MEVDEREEVQKWAARAGVSEFLPKLIAEAYNTMRKICTITKLGDQGLFLYAVKEAKAAMAKPRPDMHQMSEALLVKVTAQIEGVDKKIEGINKKMNSIVAKEITEHT